MRANLHYGEGMSSPSAFPRSAALVAGFGLLFMSALGPFGLFTVEAVRAADPREIVRELVSAPRFIWAIAAFFSVAVLDVVVALGLYGVFRHPAPALTRLALWLRVAYAVALALLLVYLGRARGASDGAAAQALVDTFSRGWLLALGVFGLHLVALGAAGLRAPVLPQAIAWLLVLAGLGYIVDALCTQFVPSYALNLAAYLFFGEIVLMVWLIFRGLRPPPAMRQ